MKRQHLYKRMAEVDDEERPCEDGDRDGDDASR